MSGRKANGRSSIYQGADGRWHGYVSMGVKDNGKPDRRHVQAATEKAVTGKVRELERKRDAGSVTTPGKVPTVGDWLTYWLENIAKIKVRASTWQSYESKVTQHLIPGLGAHRLDRLQPEHVEGFYAVCQASKADDGRGLSPATVLQIHRILSRALTVAQKRGRVNRNVCTLVEAPSISDRDEATPPTMAEAKAVLAAAAGRRNAARWSVALALGLRQGEALGLAWEHVDLDRQLLHVRWQLQRLAGRGLVYVQPKSMKSRRTMPVPDPVAEALREHRKAQEAEREQAGSAWEMHGPPGREPGGLVFAQPNGRPIDPRRDWGDWKDLLRDAGVPEVPLHAARHSTASILAALHVHPRVAMEILGHSQISLTMERYTHVEDAVKREALNRMGDALW